MAQQTVEQFGATVKAKHPEYADMPDAVVGQKVLDKFPQYRDMVSAAPTAPAQPGVGARFSESTGIPTSRQGLREAGQGLAQAAKSPIGIGGEAIRGYGRNILSEGRRAVSELRQPGGGVEAPGVGLPPAIAKFLLRGPLGPVGGTGVANAMEDIPAGNVRGSTGDILGSFLNAFLLRKGMLPNAEKSANKLAFAAGKDTAQPIKNTLEDLRAQPGPAPKDLDDFISVVGSASKNMNKEVNAALGPIAHQQIFPTSIIQKLDSLITPNMAHTADGVADIRRIRAAQREFSKPWSLGELDLERMKINKRLNPFYNKSGVDQYAALGNRNTAIDKVISDTIRDTVYPRMDIAAGKPSGYFRSLKQRQGDLLNLESSLKEETSRLKDTTARIQGGPRFSAENVGVHVGPTGVPHSFLRGLVNVVKKPNPLATANRRVAQGFYRGNPAARAATATLPFRQTLFPQEPQQ